MEQAEQLHAEEIRRRSEEERQAAYVQEVERLDTELLMEAQDLVRQEQSRREQEFQDALRAAEEERAQAEEALRFKEQEVLAALAQERDRTREVRERDEQESKRRREEEQRRREEITRRRADEDSRRQSDQSRRKTDDEERRRREEEARRRGETDRRRREEELRKQEEARRLKEGEERKKKEEEQRKKEEDARVAAMERQRQDEARQQREEEKRKEEDQRLQRIQSQIAGAQSFFDAGDFEHALVEVAKALVNDPMNAAALDLEQKIKDAQAGGLSEGVASAEEPAKEETPKPKPKPKSKIKKLKPTIKLGQRATANKEFKVPVMIAAAVVAVIVLVVLVVELRKPAPPVQRTFVVLPWTASSNSLEETLLGSALAQEVTERFERLNAIAVTGYATSYNLSVHTDQPEYQPFQLGSFSTLRGSVTRSGDTVAVALELLDSLGRMEWTGGAMESVARLSELPDEIAAKVADALGFSSGDKSDSFNYRRSVRNPDAYQFYLRAIEMRHRQTRESQRNALAVLEQAIQLDPKFSEALAAAADILISEYDLGWTQRDTALARARKFAESAVSSDPGITDGYIQLGRLLAVQKNYKEALVNFENALKLAPGNSRAHLEYGKALLMTGKTSEASDEFLQAYKLDPCDPVALETCGLAEAFLHVPRRSINYYLRELYFVDDSAKTIIGPMADVVASDPDLSLTYNGQVIAACERSMELNPDDYISMYRLARLKQLLGIWQEANALLGKAQSVLQATLRQHPKDAQALAYQALVLTRLGRFPEAVSSARRAVEMDPRNAEIHYLTAEMYSLQMYSAKKKQIDPQKKADGLQALKEAIAIHYDLSAVTNADFFNMADLPEFRSALQEPAE